MAPIVERITDIPILQLGEGPHWDDKTQSLYFVDILGKTINKYVPSTRQHTKAQLEKATSIIIPVEGKEHQFVGAIKSDIVIITWDGQSEKVAKIEKIGEVAPKNKNTLNDGKCDSKGRLWIGAIDYAYVLPKSREDRPKEPTGTFVVFDNKNISTQLTKVACSNGLAWNKEFSRFYYIDSAKETVDAFDVDFETGLSNRTEILSTKKHGIKGGPDGMTIDNDGNLWFATFGGSSVVKIDPRKEETVLQIIELPAQSVSVEDKDLQLIGGIPNNFKLCEVASVTWGGKNLDELYVTTSNLALHGEDLPPPNHGAVFRITNLGTTGLPAQNFVL